MKLTLPYPPSSNRYWRVWRGRAVKSTEARAYQARVHSRVTELSWHEETWPGLMEHGPVSVTFELYRPARRGDLDNSLKVLLDALKGIAFEDDKQVVEIHARRFEDKDNPRVVVTVEAA